MSTDPEQITESRTPVKKTSTFRYGCLAGIVCAVGILVLAIYVSVTAWQRQQELSEEPNEDYTAQIEIDRRDGAGLKGSSNNGENGDKSFVALFLEAHPHDPDEHPLGPLLALTEQTLTKMRQEVSDYTATIVKRERVGGELSGQQVLTCKIRQAKLGANERLIPFSVYLRFLEPDSMRGREVIWVNGANDDKLIAHEGGWKNLTTLRMQPDSRLAMIGNRYPITEIGIENLLVKLLEIGGEELRRGTCQVEVSHDLAINDRPCSRIEIRQTERREGQEFFRAEIYLDHELELPVRYAAYDWPEAEGGKPVLLEQYTYADLELNVGLKDADFDPANPEYKYH